MINTKIKQELSDKGFEELGKGKFYHRSKLAELNSNIKGQGLNVVSGFRFTLSCMAPQKTFLQIDMATRILRTKTLYEEMMATQGTEQDKNLLFKGATVLARYGNYKTYTIESIEYGTNLYSQF